MLTLNQRVTVHCTDTEKDAQGVITKIRPDGFDVAIDTLRLRLQKYRPGIYVGSHAGMEFVVRTQIR